MSLSLTIPLVCSIALMCMGCQREPSTMNADKRLVGKKIAILSDNGVERSELLSPRQALTEAGALTVVVSPREESIRSWEGGDWSERISVDVSLRNAQPQDYDGLLLPGGVMNPDRLRMNAEAVAFVRAFVQNGKPIAAICHGPWTLIEADGVQHHRVTSWPSLRTDLTNAGATWVDEPVVVDRNVVTSRKPDDLPNFNKAIIQLFAESAVPVAQ